MHEIVTLQFGEQANYVGTHFWNAQESYFTYGDDQAASPVDHDVHFRAGLAPGGEETFTPRTVIYDLKQSFGSLRRDNALYQDQDTDAANATQWPGTPSILHEPAIPPSAYQTALYTGSSVSPTISTSSVRYWSDYAHVFHHPRSIVQLAAQDFGALTTTSTAATTASSPGTNGGGTRLDRWEAGSEAFAALDTQAGGLLDRDLRPWLEECDHVQGVQVFVGQVDGAWGGFAAGMLEGLRDEMGKGAMWVWALEDGGRMTRDRALMSMAGRMRSLAAMTSSASMYVPLTGTPKHLPAYVAGFEATSRWHTSALQVAAIESATLPTRLRSTESGRQSYDNVEAVLCEGGKRRMVYAEYSVSAEGETANGTSDSNGMTNGHHDHAQGNDARMRAISRNHRSDGIDAEMQPTDLEFDISLTPEISHGDQASQRGHSPSGSVFSRALQLRGDYLSSIEVEELAIRARDRWASSVKSSASQTNLLFPLLTSYPRIFDFRTAGLSQRSTEDAVRVKSALTAGNRVAEDLRTLARVGRGALPLSDRDDLCETLLGLANEYVEDWSGDEGDDGEDDDD